jgi:hypothetical protein
VRRQSVNELTCLYLLTHLIGVPELLTSGHG